MITKRDARTVVWLACLAAVPVICRAELKLVTEPVQRPNGAPYPIVVKAVIENLDREHGTNIIYGFPRSFQVSITPKGGDPREIEWVLARSPSEKKTVTIPPGGRVEEWLPLTGDHALDKVNTAFDPGRETRVFLTVQLISGGVLSNAGTTVRVPEGAVPPWSLQPAVTNFTENDAQTLASLLSVGLDPKNSKMLGTWVSDGIVSRLEWELARHPSDSILRNLLFRVYFFRLVEHCEKNKLLGKAVTENIWHRKLTGLGPFTDELNPIIDENRKFLEAHVNVLLKRWDEAQNAFSHLATNASDEKVRKEAVSYRNGVEKLRHKEEK